MCKEYALRALAYLATRKGVEDGRGDRRVQQKGEIGTRGNKQILWFGCDCVSTGLAEAD